ncbi:MAG: aspartyl protease [Anaerolinea sp.]|nr:aspartyl protease [Anaerolinea sp.]
MGQVFVRLTITNALDEGRASEGDISPSDVRSVVVEDVMVDTGASHLCLPANVIRALGLKPDRDAVVETASGITPTRIFLNARISIEGRSATMECLELPEGTRPLLGAIPMQSLGVEPDLTNHRLRLLPEGPTHSYLMAL